MKIVFYCQHVLGIGHFFRSLEICRALREHEVMLVTGGSRVETLLPKHVREIRLPDLRMDQEFKGLYSSRYGASLEQIKTERRQRLLALIEEERPDVFLIELYPFGRKAFRFELDPVLQALRTRKLPACTILCSVRDILVEKEDRFKHESRAVETLNRYFDAVLVHADPRLAELGETFEQSDQIAIPVVYTGYIAASPGADAGPRLRLRLGIDPSDVLVVASAGGGNVGAPLLAAAIKAFQKLDTPCRRYLQVFTGPFLEAAEFEQLNKMAARNVRIERFTTDFLSYLAAADLSLSMGGYNTTMNILAAGVPALVWPFPQNREQRMRATRLAARGALRLLNDADLEPDRLAVMIAELLASARRPSVDVDLDGAARAAEWINHNVKRIPVTPNSKTHRLR
jgi:predicted glycosyltransferase